MGLYHTALRSCQESCRLANANLSRYNLDGRGGVDQSKWFASVQQPCQSFLLSCRRLAARIGRWTRRWSVLGWRWFGWRIPGRPRVGVADLSFPPMDWW